MPKKYIMKKAVNKTQKFKELLCLEIKKTGVNYLIVKTLIN